MILQCSSNLIEDPANRKHVNEQLLMLVETCDEGIIKGLDYSLVDDDDSGSGSGGKWLDVGTTIGFIEEEDDDNDDNDEGINDNDQPEFLWQAYLHEEKEEEEK